MYFRNPINMHTDFVTLNMISCSTSKVAHTEASVCNPGADGLSKHMLSAYDKCLTHRPENVGIQRTNHGVADSDNQCIRHMAKWIICHLV